MKDKFVFNPRIIRYPWSDYYSNEIEDCLQAYPERYLKEIARQGYNGIWLRVILREIVSSTPFPEFGNKGKEQLRVLNRLVAKAGRFGIKVYLYFCEPLGFKAEDSFWQRHPEVKGQPVIRSDGVEFALCSSTDAVKDFLEESSFNLFKCVPGLGGVFLITASEHHTHCYSHFLKRQKKGSDPNIKVWATWAKRKFFCSRCIARQPTEVVAEIIRLINRGVKSAAPEAEVIAWTWSWSILERDPQKELIGLLPKDVILMSDWERGGKKKIGKKFYPVDEYSLSYIGPSPRFLKRFNLAKKRGMKVMAKIQISNTRELASVPYIPVPFNLGQKLKKMAQVGVDGYLGCWIFGGYPSLMTEVAGKLSFSPQPDLNNLLLDIAQREYQKGARRALSAWRHFSKAWKSYPFNIPLLYYGPMNYSLAYPLWLKAKDRTMPPSWRKIPRDKQGNLFPGDRLERWIKPFTPKEVIAAFRKLLKEWKIGLEELKRAVNLSSFNNENEEELNLAWIIFYTFESTIHIIEFLSKRGRLLRAKKLGAKKKLFNEIKKIASSEEEITKEAKRIVEKDKRIGFHSEAHSYLYTIKDLEKKIEALSSLKKSLAVSQKLDKYGVRVTLRAKYLL